MLLSVLYQSINDFQLNYLSLSLQIDIMAGDQTSLHPANYCFSCFISFICFLLTFHHLKVMGSFFFPPPHIFLASFHLFL